MNKHPVVIHVFDGSYERVFVNDEEIAYDDDIHIGNLLAEIGKRFGFNVISEEVDDVEEYVVPKLIEN